MPECAAEFAARLRAHVDGRIQVHHCAPPPSVVAQWVGLQQLYGQRVIPDSFRSLVNGAPGVLEHWAGVAGRSLGSADAGRSSGSAAAAGRSSGSAA